MDKNQLSSQESIELLLILQNRFEENMNRHLNLRWELIHARLSQTSEKLLSLYKMEKTGGQPDVVAYNEQTGEYVFYDCAIETPIGRRNLCYDQAAWEARKEFKPISSAMEIAAEMGITILTEDQYRQLQTLGNFDNKTSSWIQTPADIRKKGGALFGDFRYGRMFIYHNGAQSYYAVRGFRGMLIV